ncbi:nickel-dependent lactate racemase [Candidatus Bathyarchaeota archaeon]|nr:nickel-dependent lactate racemase [Candidatus Bathyarchaeota archaeon]MBS7627762.1 nickel-dependent lactate racemase [Candidatus Bathyarchaeota archaeon]
MVKVSLTFGAWYGDEKIELDFPENWIFSLHRLRKASDIGEIGVSDGLSNPIGSKPLYKLADGRKNAVILVDDLTRPTPAHRILPHIVRELERGGIGENRIKIVMAIAAHRPLTPTDLGKKLGKEILNSLEVVNHNPYENLVYLGESLRGTPIYLNGDVYEADLKIGVGSVIPHPSAGFGGGGKIILPGVVGMETIEHNHYSLLSQGRHGFLEGSILRVDAEDVARRVGLEAVVNVVINEGRGIAGLFFGDPIDAHRAAVSYGRSIYGIPSIKNEKADVLITNAYPIDTELIQAGKALWAQDYLMKKGGTIVLLSACSEGMGHHYLIERRRAKERAKGETGAMEKEGETTEKKAIWSNLIVFSPNLTKRMVQKIFPGAELIGNWKEVLEEVERRHGKAIRAQILTCGSIQCPLG